MKLIQAALATSLLLATSAFAAYQGEANVGYTNTNPDAAGLDNTDQWNIGGKYYLAPVQVSNVAVAESAFLGAASHVGIDYTDDDTSNDISLNGKYYIPNTQFAVEATVGRKEKDLAGGGSVDDNHYMLGAVYRVNGNTEVKAGFTDDGNDTNPVIGAKYVGPIGTMTMGLKGDILFADDTGFDVGADVYLDPTLSVGLGYVDSGAPGTDGELNLNAMKFFNANVAAGVKYIKGDNYDGFGLTGTLRF